MHEGILLTWVASKNCCYRENEIRQTKKEYRGKEYEPRTLQTYRNDLRRYFLERSCPPAVDNFDLEKSSAIEFEEVSMMLSMKKKDLKQKGLGNS